MRVLSLITTVMVALTMTAEAIQKFKVQTKVIEGNKKLDGLWATLYHTGAGTADVTFQSNKTIGFQAFLNHTQFQWDYSGAEYIPFSLSLRYQTYAAWGPLEVTPGYGDEYYGKGFKLTKTGSIVDTFQEWSGWLVCDWWHQVPQLFWIQSYYKLKVIPSCARVELIAKP